MWNEQNVRAEVYKKTDKGVYYVKIKLLDLGMFISGITVRPSIKNPNGPLWVLMPQYLAAPGKYKNYIEWDGNDNRLRLLLETRARSAVAQYERELSTNSQARPP